MSDHEWCRDVSRDEAVRAAEDAAAVPSIQHRDLPEQVALLWASLGDLIGRVVRLEGEMDAGQDDSASPAEGLRTERVTLEVTQRTESYAPLSEFDWTSMLRSACRGRLFEGESVRVVDTTAEAMQQSAAWDGAREAYSEGIARVKAERDAAREECERLRAERDDALLVLPACCGRLSDAAATVVQERDHARSRVSELLKDCETYGRAVLALQGQLDLANARVAELEAAAAPAANASGEKQEPVGYGVRTEWGQFRAGLYTSQRAPANLERGDEVVPLYAAPQPPRGWLTEGERGALKRAFDLLCDDDGDQPLAGRVQGLLARSSPPKVRVPQYLPMSWAHERDGEWIAAIRDAGGEVEG